MQSSDEPKGVREEAVAFRPQAAEHEIQDMPGWTIEALRKALKEGEDSGWIEDFDFDAFIEEMHAEYDAEK